MIMTTETDNIQREKWFLVYSIDGFEHRCMRDTIIKMFDNEQEVLKEVEKLKERINDFSKKAFGKKQANRITFKIHTITESELRDYETEIEQRCAKTYTDDYINRDCDELKNNFIKIKSRFKSEEKIVNTRAKLIDELKQKDESEISHIDACKVVACKPSQVLLDELFQSNTKLQSGIDKDASKKVLIDLQKRLFKKNLSINPKIVPVS